MLTTLFLTINEPVEMLVSFCDFPLPSRLTLKHGLLPIRNVFCRPRFGLGTTQDLTGTGPDTTAGTGKNAKDMHTYFFVQNKYKRLTYYVHTLLYIEILVIASSFQGPGTITYVLLCLQAQYNQKYLRRKYLKKTAKMYRMAPPIVDSLGRFES